MKNTTKCYCGHTTYCDCSPLEEHKENNHIGDTNEMVETLYTEEQMRMAFEYGKGVGWLELKDDFEDYIQSLKQTKQ